jgi:hypothetical protein
MYFQVLRNFRLVDSLKFTMNFLDEDKIEGGCGIMIGDVHCDTPSLLG